MSNYLKLIGEFLNRELAVTEFEEMYLNTFKNDATIYSTEIYAVLDELFWGVDAFCADPNLRDERDIDEDQLRHLCKLALQTLQSHGKTDVQNPNAK